MAFQRHETQSQTIESQSIYGGHLLKQHQPGKQDRGRSTQSAIVNAVCPKGFPMYSTALAARAFCDTPKKHLDLNTTIATHAVRLFRRMTQEDDENDRMARHIAKHHITQPRPVKANGPIAFIFNFVHAWGAEIDEHLWFQDAEETRVNIRHGPMQSVEQAITRASTKHSISKAEASRNRIGGAALTVWTLTLADINNYQNRPH